MPRPNSQVGIDANTGPKLKKSKFLKELGDTVKVFQTGTKTVHKARTAMQAQAGKAVSYCSMRPSADAETARRPCTSRPVRMLARLDRRRRRPPHAPAQEYDNNEKDYILADVGAEALRVHGPPCERLQELHSLEGGVEVKKNDNIISVQ